MSRGGDLVVCFYLCPAVNDVEESEGLPSLDKPGWYSQGNWPHLHELLKTMTGKPDPKVQQPCVHLKPRTEYNILLIVPHGENRGQFTLYYWS